MLAQFKENIQAFLAGKFPVKVTICFVRVGKTAELGHAFFHK
jgi:hypothetical protein